MRRVTLPVVLTAVTIVLLATVAVAQTAAVTSGRLYGSTRTETSVAISRADFPEGAQEVRLVAYEPSAGLASTKGPLLILPADGSVPPVLRDELCRLRPSRVVALAGPSEISDATLEEARRAAACPDGGGGPTPTPSASPSPSQTPPAGIACSGPVTTDQKRITAGGTYRVNIDYSGGDAAVKVVTSAPVTITGCVKSKARVIDDPGDGIRANVTVDGLRGEWTGTSGQARFLNSAVPAAITVRRSQLIRTSGIFIYGDLTPGIKVDVLDNRAENIFRYSGGFVQFFQMNGVIRGDVEVARNSVRNERGKSNVEDIVSIYQSSGTQGNPIHIHHNDFRGAYSYPPGGGNYTGGGIMAGDSPKGYAERVTDVLVERNKVVGTTNFGIALAAGGGRVVIRDNCVLKVAGGDRASGDVGIYSWNYHGDPDFVGATVTGNRVGWVQADGTREDWWLPHVGQNSGNVHLPNPITESSC
jgi:hypothetical protein